MINQKSNEKISKSIPEEYYAASENINCDDNGI
jgi:hypothetical protein